MASSPIGCGDTNPNQALDQVKPSSKWSPDLRNNDVRAVIAASIAINVLVLAIPFYINRVYTSILPQQSGDSLLVITGMLIAVVILDIALKIGRSWVLSLLCGAEEHQNRINAVRHVLAAPLEATTTKPVQERLEQIRASSLLRNRFLQQWIFERIDLPFVILYLLVMAIIGGWLAVVPIATALVFYNQAQKAAFDATHAIEQRYLKQEFRDGVLLSALGGMETVKGLGIEGFLIRRLEPIQEALSTAEYQQQVVNAKLQHIGQLYGQLTGLLVVTIGSVFVIHHDLATGALAACTLLSRQVSQPFSRYFSLTPRNALIRYGENKLEQLNILEEEQNFYSDNTIWSQGTVEIGSLRVQPGDFCILTDTKTDQLSELVDEIAGHRPTDLCPLRIAGQDLSALRSSERRKAIRLVESTPHLFNGTILDNLCGFRTSSRREHAIELCKQLGIHNAIISLPRGYETAIGEQADFPLSQSVTFRIKVAAALMEKPALLLIDASMHQLNQTTLQWLSHIPSSVPRLIAMTALPYGISQPINSVDIGQIRGRSKA
jgi:ABC-type bacteriocin/lantibiotic exporter with double-glycine peptidase domain